MSKEIRYGADAKSIIREGIDAVADAVKVTLGPKGQNVLLSSQFNDKVTKDGVSVAREIEIKDNVKNAGAKLVKKACSKTAEDCGDGTTTSAVLAQTIVNEGIKLIAAGVNPMEMKKGIDIAVKEATKYFKEKSTKVETAEDLIKIATISANGDSAIGKLVGDVISQVGSDGVVTIDTSKTMDTYIEKVNGLRLIVVMYLSTSLLILIQ
jgi:chaperonin GroEL